MNASIDQAVLDKTITAAEHFAAHNFARIIGSAILAAANPGDPGQAFASAFLDDVFRQVGPPAAPTPELVVGSPTTEPGATAPVGGTEATLPIATTTGPALDDDGNLMPGAVDTALPVAEQMAALAEQLQGQGLSAQEAGLLAFDAVWRESAQVLSPPTAASANWSLDERQARIAEVEQALEQDLRAQQAREDSLLSPEDLLANAGGPGPARALVQPVLNRNFDAALNAAADVTGLFAPMQALQGDLDRLQALQAESRLDGMRQAMRGAGVTNVPEGFEKAWDANGNIVKDYKATLENLTKTYEGFVRDQRLRANWGDDYKSVRIGNSQMTVQDFETRSLQVQQRAANDAFERGKVLIATGQLPLKNGDYALTLGTYVDSQVRLDLRDFGKVEGIVDSRASNLFAVNRYIRGAGLVGIPDLRLGSGLFSDVTLSPKDGLTDQLRRWNVITPNDTIIIRPDQLGGAYVVPRSTIRPLLLPRKGP